VCKLIIYMQLIYMLVNNIQLQKFQVMYFERFSCVFYVKVALSVFTVYLAKTRIMIFTWQQNCKVLLLNKFNTVIQTLDSCSK
jgi:hypothetical protein